VTDKVDWAATPHEPDPHLTVGAIMDGDSVWMQSGDWSCYKCKVPLKGTYLRPVLPWEHRPPRRQAVDATELPGLATTE
jgi:hypothetical protein